MSDSIFDKLFGKQLGWPRYYMPRTGFALFGSLYFFVTFQFRLFLMHLTLEVLCLILMWIFFPLSGFYGLLIPRIFVPFIMGRYACMNHLRGAYAIDWVIPVLFLVSRPMIRLAAIVMYTLYSQPPA